MSDHGLRFVPVSTVATTVPVRLGFMPESEAIPDPDHPGLRRAGPRSSAPYGSERVEFHSCAATDLTTTGADDIGLLGAGFDAVDLSELEALQQACARVRRAGRVTDADATEIRSALDGASLRSASGRRLRVLYLADEGFIMRSAGPNGLSVVGPRSVGMNGHGGATSIHIDQDVYGTPLTQVMDGRAPSLFVHDSPDGRTDDAALLLVNLWIPLQQIVQPLVLADGRSIDRRRHQLRFGLPTGTFLDRDDEMSINDIWTMLHDGGQRWYLRSEMDHRSAWMFNTLSTAHGAGTLPGEDVAAMYHGMVEAAEAAVARSDEAAVAELAAGFTPPVAADGTPPALRSAIAAMSSVLNEAWAHPADVCGERAEDWLAVAGEARRSVVRMSLELRLVVSLED